MLPYFDQAGQPKEQNLLPESTKNKALLQNNKFSQYHTEETKNSDLTKNELVEPSMTSNIDLKVSPCKTDPPKTQTKLSEKDIPFKAVLPDEPFDSQLSLSDQEIISTNLKVENNPKREDKQIHSEITGIKILSQQFKWYLHLP